MDKQFMKILSNNIVWSWRDASFGAVIAAIAVVVTISGHVQTGLPLFIGALPAAAIGLLPTRAQRRKPARLVRLAVRNTGDVPINDLTVNVFPSLQPAVGINGLTPSAITSPNIPQTLFATILPIGIVGPSFFGIGELGPNQNAEFDVSVFPTHYVAGTVELMNVKLVYNNIIGERATQLNQVYFNILPNT